jgi:hypothetical protein
LFFDRAARRERECRVPLLGGFCPQKRRESGCGAIDQQLEQLRIDLATLTRADDLLVLPEKPAVLQHLQVVVVRMN